MSRRVALSLVAFVMAVAVTAPVFGNVPLQCSVAGVTAAQATALGATVSCRQFSISGADAGVNENQCFINNAACCSNLADPTHNLDRCIRAYNTNTNLTPGGYVCNSEATAAYNNDADSQTFYCLVDGEAGQGTSDHIGFYSVSGQIASSTTPANVGDSRFPHCGGAASALNCFDRADSTNSRQTPLLGTWSTFGSTPHQIQSAGGLSPVPTVRVTRPGDGGCPADSSRLTWDDAEIYTATMKNFVATPVLGVNLWSNSAPCVAAPDGSNGWTLIGAYPLGAGITGICQPLAGPSSWFSTSVRVKGPSNTGTEVETYRSANSQCIGPVGTPVRIASLSARYAGRGVVRVAFTSGTEGGVAGYHVTRASSPAGPYTQVSDLLDATGDNSRYEFSDRVRPSLGRMQYYRVDIVNADGTVEHSGATSVNLPGSKAKRLDRD